MSKEDYSFLKKLVGSYPGEKPWESKTAIMATLTCIAPWVYPPLTDWIKDNPELFSSAVGALLMLLKSVSWMTTKK